MPARLLRACGALAIAAVCTAALAAPADAAARRGTPGAPRTSPSPSIRPAARFPRIVTPDAPGGAPSARALEPPALRAPGSTASYPQQVATYPRQGQTRVPANATLYFVFDQPTGKTGSFSVADLDPSSGGGLVQLDVPQWSALGDTVFLYPTAPLAFGHYYGMRVNTIMGTDATYSNDLPIVYFTVVPRAKIVAISPSLSEQTLDLIPAVPVPISIPVREVAGTAAFFTSARIELFAGGSLYTDAQGVPLDPATPLETSVQAVSIPVGRDAVARLETAFTLSRATAGRLAGGRAGIHLTFEGTDETGLPIRFETSRLAGTSSPDTLELVLRPGAVRPAIASSAVIESAVLEWPLQGAAVAAGDTLLPRAVVTGSGTGPFRAAFRLDGELLAIEEGFLESGRPTTVTMRGPIPTRRLGEHRLQFVVETPQTVAARPVSFVCVPPVHGVSPDPGRAARAAAGGSGAAPASGAGSAAGQERRRLTASATVLGTGRSTFGSESGSGVAWGFGSARYDLGGGAALEANASLRFRADDPENGSARPEQVRVRLLSTRGSMEWSDAAPALADSAPLFMSAVPRRAAQARYDAGPLGLVQGYVAVESRPVSAGGPADETRTDIYAGRITRDFGGDRIRVSGYGGYAHADPTPGGSDAFTRAQSVWGGMARALLYRDWTLLLDASGVHHRRTEPASPGAATSAPYQGLTRGGWRSEIRGSVGGVSARMEGFRYQPGLATAINPYALSNRVGGAIDASRGIGPWRFAAGFRSEQPAERVGLMPTVRVDRLQVGGTLTLNPSSWVSPGFVRITHHGAYTDYSENRLEGQFTRAEPGVGRTTARLAAATYRDSKAADARRRVYSGSLVSATRPDPNVTNTLTLGYEEDIHEDLDKTNRTVQGTFESRWEAVAGRFLVTPYLTGAWRDYEALGTKETRLGGQLQLTWLRFAGLGENALALTGRLARVNLKTPASKTTTDAGVDLVWGQRFDW